MTQNTKYHILKVAYTALLYFSPVFLVLLDQLQAGHVDIRLLYGMTFPIAIDIIKRFITVGSIYQTATPVITTTIPVVEPVITETTVPSNIY